MNHADTLRGIASRAVLNTSSASKKDLTDAAEYIDQLETTNAKLLIAKANLTEQLNKLVQPMKEEKA